MTPCPVLGKFNPISGRPYNQVIVTKALTTGSLAPFYHQSDHITGVIIIGCMWSYSAQWHGLFFIDSDSPELAFYAIGSSALKLSSCELYHRYRFLRLPVEYFRSLVWYLSRRRRCNFLPRIWSRFSCTNVTYSNYHSLNSSTGYMVYGGSAYIGGIWKSSGTKRGIYEERSGDSPITSSDWGSRN